MFMTVDTEKLPFGQGSYQLSQSSLSTASLSNQQHWLSISNSFHGQSSHSFKTIVHLNIDLSLLNLILAKFIIHHAIVLLSDVS